MRRISSKGSGWSGPGWLSLAVLAGANSLVLAPLHAAIAPPADEALTLHVNTISGEMYFTGVPGSNMSFYQISSASASLDDTRWTSFQDQSLLNPDGALTTAAPGQIVDWMEMAHNDSIFQDMACANMMPTMNGLPVTFDTAARTYTIGDAYRTAGQRDLQFIYNVDLNYTPDYSGTVVYEPAVPEPAALGTLGSGGLVLLVRRRRADVTKRRTQ